MCGICGTMGADDERLITPMTRVRDPQASPGYCATFADGRLSIHQYWDMQYAVEERSDSEWADLVREGVQEAVRRQMVSDVPLGSFLSAGPDSSAIVATMADSAESVTTFTVGHKREDLAYEIVLAGRAAIS
jgi:asparagine synthetase B (glutamine-hydrolysing)